MSMDITEAAEPPAPGSPDPGTAHLAALAQAVRRGWPELRTELLPPEAGRPERLAVTRADAREEVSCRLDPEAGWHYLWLWPHPRRLAPVSAAASAARTLASALGCRTLTV
ncbi:hypothetical protein EDD29_6397 [Actinocorallia herbida]|uniref:Uncharacterized protein n=1 Tax=Actinocorallia herbida TaxID=58109 RepID=A0A3N1D6H7_9ACTN|nr:hypothetical protein [Actinocorallia herbida]ROO88718.1 hypothetical protein EDD29_6397 [Actinocorallia herbida]